MASFLVMALAVPQAFGRDALAFGLAYLLVNVIHATLFTRAPDVSSAQAIWRIAPFNSSIALLIVITLSLEHAALKRAGFKKLYTVLSMINRKLKSWLITRSTSKPFLIM
jgi:hypothetical protein